MNRILVTYATKSGSTAGVAECIGEQLAQAGTRLEVRPIGQTASLQDYGAPSSSVAR